MKKYMLCFWLTIFTVQSTEIKPIIGEIFLAGLILKLAISPGAKKFGQSVVSYGLSTSVGKKVSSCMQQYLIAQSSHQYAARIEMSKPRENSVTLVKPSALSAIISQIKSWSIMKYMPQNSSLATSCSNEQLGDQASKSMQSGIHIQNSVNQITRGLFAKSVNHNYYHFGDQQGDQDGRYWKGFAHGGSVAGLGACYVLSKQYQSDQKEASLKK